MDDEEPEGDGGRQDCRGNQGSAEFTKEKQHDQSGQANGQKELEQRVAVVQVHVERLVEHHVERETGVFTGQKIGKFPGGVSNLSVVPQRFRLDAEPDRGLAVIEKVPILLGDTVSYLRDVFEVNDPATEIPHRQLGKVFENVAFSEFVRNTHVYLKVSIQQRAAAAIEVRGVNGLSEI